MASLPSPGIGSVNNRARSWGPRLRGSRRHNLIESAQHPDRRSRHSPENPLSPAERPTAAPWKRSKHPLSGSAARCAGSDSRLRPRSHRCAHRGRTSCTRLCAPKERPRDSPQLFVTGQSVNSARVMNEITNCCPETASRHACRSEWVFLKRIDTTFVSRKRTFISTSGGRRTLIAEFPDHPIKSIGFERIAVIGRGEFADRWLQSWNTDFRVG